ncbi:MAG TPA: MBL fold metallo-hydrolase [Pseudogracilibacillus sp.]|nr:MBL fold metallo-hydrolase [Pseudogracilibacillus sp.]
MIVYQMIEFKSHASGSSGNLYTLSDGNETLMIEAGIRFKDIQKALDFKLSNVEGVLLSHSHGDHSKSVKNVLKAGIPVYMLEETRQELDLKHHRIKIIEAGKQFDLGSYKILPFNIQHDVPGVGFLIQSKAGKRTLFITDSYYCKYKFKNLNIIAIEANYSQEILDDNILNGRVPQVMRRRLMQSHFSLENVINFLKANDLSIVDEIHLLHLSDTNSNEKEFKTKVQEATGKRVIIA